MTPICVRVHGPRALLLAGLVVVLFTVPAAGAEALCVRETSVGIVRLSQPDHMATGPGDSVWFTAAAEPANASGTRSGPSGIGEVTPSGQVNEFTEGIGSNAPEGIAAGPDGNMWFAEGAADQIGRITPTGQVTEFSTGISAGAAPLDIAAGPDGNMWFTEANGDRIGRITPTGQVTEFPVGTIPPGGNPAGPDGSLGGITAGPDGNMWFVDAAANRIGRITPSGQITEFSAGIDSTAFLAGGAPDQIVEGPDGNIWFTETAAGKVSRITPAGTVTEFSKGISQFPTQIVVGPDGALWFNEFLPHGGPSVIGRITTSGQVSEFHLGDVFPYGLADGPDGTLWFTGPVQGAGPGQVGWVAPSCPPVHLAVRHARVSRAGMTSVGLGCGAGIFGCAGTLTVDIRVAGRHGRRRTVSIGAATYLILAGHRGNVAVRINARGRRLLARAPRRRLKATATAKGLRRVLTLTGG